MIDGIECINRLAYKIENGHLLASMGLLEDFLQAVCDKMESLEAQIAKHPAAVKAALIEGLHLIPGYWADTIAWNKSAAKAALDQEEG